MARYRTSVDVGGQTVWVEADDMKQLIKDVSYLTQLGYGAENEDVTFFHRKAGKFEYFGFRRPDGAEVTFGQLSDPDDKAHQLFAYHPKSEGYKGFLKYDHEKGEARPVSKREK